MAAKKAKKPVKKASKMKDMKAGKSAGKVKGGIIAVLKTDKPPK